MARIENLTPALKKGTWKVEGSFLVFLPEDGKPEIHLPYECNSYIKYFNGVYSLSEIVQIIVRKKIKFRYSTFVEVIRSICNARQFSNNEVVEQHLDHLPDPYLENTQSRSIETTDFNAEYFTKSRLLFFLKKTVLANQNEDDKHIKKLLKHSKLLRLQKGDQIIEYGSVGDKIYVLLSGLMGVYQGESQGLNKNMLALLEPICLFGESAAILHQKRNADVVALDNSWVLEIDIQKVIDAQSKEDHLDFKSLHTRLLINQILVAAPMFKGLPNDVINLFISKCELHHFKLGKIIINQGESTSYGEPSFYFILKGSVSIIKDGQLLSNMGAGNYFGEVGVLNEVNRTATVRANSDVDLLSLNPTEFNNLLSNNFHLAIQIEKIADERMAESLAHLDEDSDDLDSFTQSAPHFEIDPSFVEISTIESSYFDQEKATSNKKLADYKIELSNEENVEFDDFDDLELEDEN
ncbi:MAG: cyclic nucleotide-binding domain-containing protein [Bdellovibrionales bacterium]|nr:cyclic nucleotide-binding domain-containing protein [Bdellovibrionales bacterium]